MSQITTLFPAAELLEGEMRGAHLPDGTRIAVCNVNGAYYATDDTCTHENASLSEEGMIDGGTLVCGWHFCAFDAATGAAINSPCKVPLRTYPVSVVEGTLHVEH